MTMTNVAVTSPLLLPVWRFGLVWCDQLTCMYHQAPPTFLVGGERVACCTAILRDRLATGEIELENPEELERVIAELNSGKAPLSMVVNPPTPRPPSGDYQERYEQMERAHGRPADDWKVTPVDGGHAFEAVWNGAATRPAWWPKWAQPPLGGWLAARRGAAESDAEWWLDRGQCLALLEQFLDAHRRGATIARKRLEAADEAIVSRLEGVLAEDGERSARLRTLLGGPETRRRSKTGGGDG